MFKKIIKNFRDFSTKPRIFYKKLKQNTILTTIFRHIVVNGFFINYPLAVILGFRFDIFTVPAWGIVHLLLTDDFVEFAGKLSRAIKSNMYDEEVVEMKMGRQR